MYILRVGLIPQTTVKKIGQKAMKDDIAKPPT